jgi:hypothetical protein
MTTFLSSAWRDWYKAAHGLRSLELATAFETYVTSVLDQFHDDFLNPDPTGSFGDGACDGLAAAGTIAYACFGSTTERDAERKLENKVTADFERAKERWSSFVVWRFVTNSPVGPLATEIIRGLQEVHGEGADRPIKVYLWRPTHLWSEVIINLPREKLDLLYPGCPGAAHIELDDLIPLLEDLSDITAASEDASPVRPVPPDKMDYNNLPPLSQMELGQWKHLYQRIDAWFDGLSEPDLRDHQGATFRQIYLESARVDADPRAILERIYISLGGNDFRIDSKRANAVYAVTSYFFDLCHIFEAPSVGVLDVAAN